MKVPKAQKMPTGKWRIQLRLGGESIPVTAYSEKDCIRQAQIVKSEYLAGKRQPPTEDSSKLPTLREAINTYLASRVLSPATERGYVKIRDLRFQELMDRSLSDITPEDYQAACKAEVQKHSAKTVKNAWAFVSSVLRSQGITPPSVSLPQVIPNERAFLDAEEIKQFVAAVKGTKYEIPIYLALSSLRRSEIMALRWEHVDLKRRRILVKGAAVVDKDGKLVQKRENKNRSSVRYVPIMMDELYDALEAAQQPDGLVVTCHSDTIRQNVHRICAANGLPSVSVHGLRHSFASLAYSLEVPEKITMEIGGWHDDQTMRRIYTHIAQSDMQRYQGKLTGFFKGDIEK